MGIGGGSPFHGSTPAVGFVSRVLGRKRYIVNVSFSPASQIENDDFRDTFSAAADPAATARTRASMQLTNFSDYALRILMYAAARSDRLITIEETAAVYGVSRAHLRKVANTLTRAGYLSAVRGRSGGLKLGKSPEKIRLGDVVRLTEPDFALVECFSRSEERRVGKECR